VGDARLQRGARREVLSGEPAWSWLLILAHCWSRNVPVVAEAVDVPWEVAAPAELAGEEAREGQAAPGGQAHLAAEAVPAELAAPAELVGEEAREGQAVPGAGAALVEEPPGEAGAEYRTRI